MAKQFIISAMEEVLGEYILNMSKENLKIAALRGKLKLENVQLDGDLIGSHVLGAVGLVGFGILSCSAKSIKISIPWNNLEKEPTKFEVRGIHLVCVPLMPSTAHQMYGNGTSPRIDPRCTLRTRAKRLLLARLERNYWNGQIADEGPPMKRVQRAVKELERDMKRKAVLKRKSSSKTEDDDSYEEVLENLVFTLSEMEPGGTSSQPSVSNWSNESTTTTTADPTSETTYSVNDLPELPRDWKVKLREKVLRNMEASMHEIHIRVEVSRGALDFADHGDRSKHPGGSSGTTTTTTNLPEQASGAAAAEERAFALGFTLESLVVRTANENWEVGSHDKRNAADGSAMSSVQGHLGPNKYVVKNNKIGYFSKLSMYWDDEPPMLLAETDVLRGNYRKLSAEKLQARIAGAMDAMFYMQEPGKAVRQSLGLPVPAELATEEPHRYVVDSMDVEIRVRQSDRTEPGPISCSADVLPFNLIYQIRPHQYFQYQKLKAAMKSQQRFDTMLHQRPSECPRKNPRAWWKFAIACITARPNSRPWEDVKRIVENRSRYIELVVKKNMQSSDGNGFHAGLSDADSSELLALEDLLPTETLSAFHLLALRRAYELQREGDLDLQSSKKDSKEKSKGKGRLTRFLLKGNTKKRTPAAYDEVADEPFTPDMSKPPRPAQNEDVLSNKSVTLMDAMNLRLGKKRWYIHWKLHDAVVGLSLVGCTDDSPIARLFAGVSGSIRSFGQGKRDLFIDIVQFDVLHRETKVMFVSPTNGEGSIIEDDEIEEFFESEPPSPSGSATAIGTLEAAPDLSTPSDYLELPPQGIVCRIVAGLFRGAQKISISAHPATLVYSPLLFDELAEFIAPQKSQDRQAELEDYIRDAATPLAKKAQLALLSPSAMGLHLNVAAPKIWLPVSSWDGEGALYLDAGTLKVSGVKTEGETDMNWNTRAADIQVNFVRGRNTSFNGDSSHLRLLSQFVETSGKPECSIVRPFQVTINARNRFLKEKSGTLDRRNRSLAISGAVRALDAVISPVCISLVDAEMLARALGKLYSRGIHRVKRRVTTAEKKVLIAAHAENNIMRESVDPAEVRIIERRLMPRIISIKASKIEVALEGHSKNATGVSDDRSYISQESFHESSPPIRTYVVEFSQIELSRSSQNRLAHTSLSVQDASIVRLRDAAMYSPRRGVREANDSQYCILVRSSSLHDLVPPSRATKAKYVFTDLRERPPIVKASLFHDGSLHLDEVEIDVDSVVLRVTPTSLKDCAKAFRKLAELAELTTREMERKVHEEGRKARQLDGLGRDQDINKIHAASGVGERPASPAVSEARTEFSLPDRRPNTAPTDSSILFRVTLNESTLLAGRPTEVTHHPRRGETTSFAVIQVLSNALIMFQSIENPDGTGSKTIHCSVDNVSSLVNTEFERLPPSRAQPMIGPTGAEFRIVYATENLGCVVAQDISLDCENVKACLTPNDLTIMLNITDKMAERLRAFSTETGTDAGTQSYKPRPHRRSPVFNLIRFQTKGTGIATTIRAEVQSFSFVLLQAFKSHEGAPEFLDFLLRDVKARVEGCMSALSGECSGELSVNFFNPTNSDWEYAVEPFPMAVGIDQMPNEFVLHLKPECMMKVNVTSILLEALAQTNFNILRDRSVSDGKDGAFLTPSVLSTVGLRTATESRSIRVTNLTGFDIHVVPDSSPFAADTGFVENGATSLLETIVDEEGQNEANDFSLSLRVATTTAAIFGHREPVFDLPVVPLGTSGARLYLMRPVVATESPQPGYIELLRVYREGRTSPETAFTEGSTTFAAYYTAEPVVEWCMHNQRLRSNTGDLFSLAKGRDLLSSSVWSPEDENNTDISFDGPESGAGAVAGKPSSPERAGQAAHKSNWIRPYLKNDSPEWTDMTCTLRMARDRVMLPDSNWIWVNDWTVDLSGELAELIDADGWEYQADFETFTKKRRYYERGDACRRRRWTRTRMVRPPRFNDPNRMLKFVWETAKDDNSNFDVIVRSHLRIMNLTSTPLAFFALSPAWDDQRLIGTCASQEWLNVPISLASAVYLRIARTSSSSEPPSLTNCALSEKIVILPQNRFGSNFVRTYVDLDDVSRTILHFLVEIRCDKGMVDLLIRPVLRVINLLPCHLECHVGQAIRNRDFKAADARLTIGGAARKIVNVESMKIPSGKDCACTAVDPYSKPHVSLRVPGYKWSPWHRVVNRKSNSQTWRPSEAEDDWHFIPKGDADFADEFKTIIRFERTRSIGDPLLLVLSVECDHSPTLRVYAQYWILDKTGFGCRFSEGFRDVLGTNPDGETSRRSHLFSEEGKDPDVKNDMAIPGHEWSLGMSGMSIFFSKREKITLLIESGAGGKAYTKKRHSVRSKWVSPLDISNVMPKTVFSVEELNGPRHFELAFSVTVCPGIYARTRLITFLPRYQIVNLLHRELVVAQDGCLEAETRIPSQSSVPFHWERGAFAPKVRIGAPSAGEKDRKKYDKCWTNGRFRLDRVGITSMRLPTDGNLSSTPMVVQAEVRLATKEQSSAVVVVIWSANEQSNPLYIIRNRTPHTILCRQPLQDEQQYKVEITDVNQLVPETCSIAAPSNGDYHCGSGVGPMVLSFLGVNRIEEFVWVLNSGSVACFGFDDPEKPHILEWTCVSRGSIQFEERCKKAFLEVDAMGSSSTLSLSDGRLIRCQIGAEHSTKVIEFTEVGSPVVPSVAYSDSVALIALKDSGQPYQQMLETHGMSVDSQLEHIVEDEEVALGLRIDMPGLAVSVVDNADTAAHGREILYMQFEKIYFSFSQTREGYHEFEFRLMTLQVDNHVHKSVHPIMIFCPRLNETVPLLHMSAVRRLQQLSNTFTFRYAAIRLLDVEIYLDRRTAETIARFIEPATNQTEEEDADSAGWVGKLTATMAQKFATPDRRAPRDIEKMIHTANSGRIYFEQLHLHPVRLSLTFTQEWMEWNPGAETMMVFQFIRGMASIANAPLTFTSFVVAHVFEAPQALVRVVLTHYSSQLTKQIFGILGSLAILGAPADFISNVGTGVRDFFYEPINGAVHGPRQFIEGLEAGTQSLARGVVVGVLRGASSVTEVVNANLAGLTADDDFIDERKAHQRLLTDAMSRGTSNRTFTDSMMLAGASVARGLKSGVMGIVEQPAMYASKHGPVGFVKGVGKAALGAVVKPVVGLGDAAVLVMNHLSDATSKKQILPKIPKRLRRALPIRTPEKPNCVRLTPYDERAAKAQKIVTGGESVDDVYIGHIHIPSHLIIASDQCLWAIDRRSREPWCASWEEVSHFSMIEGGVRVVVFSQTGLKTYVFHVETPSEAQDLHKLLSMQVRKMGNSSELSSSLWSAEPESLSRHQIPGIKARQENRVFGSGNNQKQRLGSNVKDEVDLVEQCFARVNVMGSDEATFLKAIDEEAWSLVHSWGQVFSGLSSRRCIVAGVINGTGTPIQIKASKLVEGGSPCYTIPTREFDAVQGVLHAGGCLLFFGWGVVPNLLQPGNVFMHIDTNGFLCELADHKSRSTFAEAMPGYQVGFLEKSYDDAGWWAKYWLLVRTKK